MRFRSSSQICDRARHTGAANGVSLMLGASLCAPLCAGALLFGPLLTPVQAAPTVGGDENGPQVQILQPGYQDVLKGRTKILLAVKAQKFNPQFVEMFIDDKPATSGPITLSAMPSAQYDWDTKLFTDGPHKLTVRVTDTQGFRGWAEVNVYINNGRKVDSLPPSLEWLNLQSYQQLSGTAQIELKAVDNFGVKWIIVSVNPASDPAKKPALRSWLLNRPPYIVNLDTTRVPDGLYQLSAKAWDSFEQEGSADSLTVGIVNNGINATTVGEMLQGLQRLNASKTAAPVKSPPRFTVDSSPSAAAPLTSSQVAPKTSVPARLRAPASTTKTPAALPGIPKAAIGAPQVPVATTPLVPMPIATMPLATTPLATTPLAPKTPNLIARGDLNRPLAGLAAQMSGRVSRGASSVVAPAAPVNLTVSPPKGEISRIARAASPDFGSRQAPLEAPTLAPPMPSSAAMSPFSAATSLRAAARREIETQTALSRDERLAANRIASPQAEARSIFGAPALSQETSGDATTRVTLSPLEVSSAPTLREGRLSSFETLFARQWELASSMGAESTPLSPVLSSSLGVTTRITPSLPLETAAVEGADASKIPGKVASPELNRFAALPRPQKANSQGSMGAITVSPLEVKASSTLPAFHHVARSTNLRAVAARYGLPVEALAQCNNLPTDMSLIAGTDIKLPIQLKVAYNGVPIKTDAASMLIGSTGVTAFRFLFEQQGGTMTWDAKKQRVRAKKGDSEITLSIGSKTAKIGDKDVMMEMAAFLFQGRTMVPLRFFEDGLHAQVDWNPQTGRIVVAMAN